MTTLHDEVLILFSILGKVFYSLLFQLILSSTIHKLIRWKSSINNVTKELIQQSLLRHRMKNIKQKYNFIQFLENKNNLLKVVPLTLPGQKSNLHVTAFWFVHVVFLHPCHVLTFESIRNCVGIWSCLSCSSKPLDTGFVTRCFRFSSFENCQAAAIRLRSCTSCLKSDSPKFIC